MLELIGLPWKILPVPSPIFTGFNIAIRHRDCNIVMGPASCICATAGLVSDSQSRIKLDDYHNVYDAILNILTND